MEHPRAPGKIGGMLYERPALSRKPEELAKQELAKLREAGRSRRIWSFATRISWTSSGWPTHT